MDPPPKKRWADLTDDDPIEFEFEIELPQPVTVSKHGVKVKKSVPDGPVPYVPPHKKQSKK